MNNIQSKLGVRADWVVWEINGRGRRRRIAAFKNVLTTAGLNALAQAPGGSYMAPIYMVIDSATTVLDFPYSPGVTSIETLNDPTVGGDTQLILSLGQSGQETVTFSSKSGSGPYTWTLSAATVNSHATNDIVVRKPTAADTIASVLSESQYNPTYFPNKRLPATASYSPASGQGTTQFFFSGNSATNLYFAHVGLADNINIGQGTLHNYSELGYNHNNTNDLEIDVTYTLVAL